MGDPGNVGGVRTCLFLGSCSRSWIFAGEAEVTDNPKAWRCFHVSQGSGMVWVNV